MCFIIAYPVFVPSRGFLFFYRALIRSFISAPPFSSPHGDFSFSMCELVFRGMIPVFVFVPSRGFLFFYSDWMTDYWSPAWWFSSPHGDFSFSMVPVLLPAESAPCFRPLTGISLFLLYATAILRLCHISVFVPSRGFLFFYIAEPILYYSSMTMFSSPHGDFSFSIFKISLTVGMNTVFVPSRGFLFFYEEYDE